jgi:hypothetical protein
VSKKFVPTEKNIQKLLKNLSADKKSYPKDLLDARRAAYLARVTSVVSSGPHPKKGNGKGQGGAPHAAAPMTPLMKVVLTALIAANVALATYMAIYVYEHWDEVQALLSGRPSLSETFPVPPEIPTQAPELETTPEIAIPPEGTVAPDATPEPTSLSDDPQPSGNGSADSPQGESSKPDSTPEPDGKDNPGKRLGHTPHGPGDPPGQNDQDNDQDDPDKDKKDKDKKNKE